MAEALGDHRVLKGPRIEGAQRGEVGSRSGDEQSDGLARFFLPGTMQID